MYLILNKIYRFFLSLFQDRPGKYYNALDLKSAANYKSKEGSKSFKKILTNRLIAKIVNRAIEDNVFIVKHHPDELNAVWTLDVAKSVNKACPSEQKGDIDELDSKLIPESIISKISSELGSRGFSVWYHEENFAFIYSLDYAALEKEAARLTNLNLPAGEAPRLMKRPT